MKKIFAIVATTITLLLFRENEVAAQPTKFGYFDLNYVISLMPGISEVDSLLTVYEQDSLGQQYQALVKEYMIYDSMLRIHGCGLGRKADKIKRENEKHLRLVYILQNWQQHSQQTMQARHKELIQPFYDKVMIAYQEVVDEGKFTYVFKTNALLQAPQSDNLTIAVIRKLEMKVTHEM